MSKNDRAYYALQLGEQLSPKWKPTDEWVTLFKQACERTGLDPAQRQILGQVHNTKTEKNGHDYWVPKFSVLVTIDGLRVVAERSGKYEGQDGPYFCGDDGQWSDVWLNPNKPPYAAKVGIWRKGARAPIWGIALWDEFSQNSRMWRSMKTHMLSKCAEATGHRKAFPESVSGLYIEDEMPNTDPIPEGKFQPASSDADNPPQQAETPNQDQQKAVPERAKMFAQKLVESATPETLNACVQRAETKLANFPQLREKTISRLMEKLAA